MQSGIVANDIEFDWDDADRKHLAAYKAAPAELEHSDSEAFLERPK